MTATRARGVMLAEALRCLGALGYESKRNVGDLAVFLQSPSDDLVVATLDLFARLPTTEALPEILVLFRKYPADDR